ncbi:MAG: WD40 repeat domain-containing protein, partial [Gemmataceae bacterium]|nr:WD40 repeat domain-containing protein [Gemmataceae bacterium]
RRGLAFAAGVALLQAPPGVSATLHDAAVRAAAGGAASPAVAALANEAPGAGFRLGWAAVGVLAGGLVFGVGAVMMTLPADPPAVAPPPRPAEPEPARPVARLGWSPHRIGNAAFALTADEKEIVTVSPEGIVRRFDAATGKPLGQKQLTPRDDISTGSQAHARLSADGRTAAIQEWLGDEFFARSRVSVWDVPAGKLLFRRASDAGTRVGLFALSPDGRRLAVREDVGERTVLRAYDTATGAGKDVGELEYNVYDLQFSADGRRVVASQISARRGDGPREFLGCYDVVAGKEVWKRPGHCSQFAFSPDGRTVAFVAHGAPARTFHLIETDPATGAVTERDQGCGINTAHPNSPVAFAPDSRTLLSDYSDDLVSWDVTDAKEVGRIRKPDGYGGGYGPMLGAFSRDGKTVVTNWGSLQRWDLTTGKPLFDAPPGDGLRGPVEHVAFTPDGREVVAWGWGLDSGRWEVASGKRAAYRRERFGFQLVATPAGLRSVHCDHQNRAAHRVTIHDPVAGAAVETVQWTSEKEVGINGIRAYALAADGHTLLMAHGDEPRAGGKTYVTAHDIPTGRRLARFGVPGHLYFGQSPFSPCGRWVVLAGKVYHTHTGTELFTPAAREGERLKPGGRMADGPVWFSADGRLLAGRLAGTDGRGSGGDLAVWELASGKVLARLPRGGRAGQVVFGPDGRTVALADARGVAAHDLLTGRPMAGFPAPDITPESNNERGAGAQTVAFAPDGRTLATGHSDGSVAVWAVPRPAPAEAVADLWA